MRLAADRVIASLRRLDYAEAPVWLAARSRLLARLLPESSGGGSGGGGGEASAGGEEAGAARLAAAVAAAQAGEARGVPLEAAGLPFEERRPKVGTRCSWGARLTAEVTGACSRRGQSRMARPANPLSRPIPSTMWPLQPRVARPDHLIDVSDLDPALPRWVAGGWAL